eukprot:CAMPEP_0175816066 /NCGR_PEP_ID=MMETSP0107_2-20121207/6305_1 /TAXON_ID=195067 ORGANISM="Goniomonas pacifica, Strain CCMP1869" /NCGR_SAMPLE_ID=MMETSP0107_2 /ASSEMBLY_ACC=CAM_ASM_000203 /LENGTH=57 /DNA_ID=CAMNT_0017128157 /DNA_START=157 /DNA_END=330 /DNA_ORIENTATION=-
MRASPFSSCSDGVFIIGFVIPSIAPFWVAKVSDKLKTACDLVGEVDEALAAPIFGCV